MANSAAVTPREDTGQGNAHGAVLIAGRTTTLRPASDADLDTLARWFGDPAFVVWWGGTPKNREEVAERYLRRDPARQAFIVEAVGMPIGYIQAWSDQPPDGGVDIVLVPEAQGRGFGVDAVRALSVHLRAAGWRQITVDPVARNHRAIAAFENAGFVKIGEQGEHVFLAFEPAHTGSA
ncbi:MAG TPA: GNAT family N-acetyltransferase [bacterium]|nr:GNAT family N-acetyltransferase [bacterium]